MYVVYMSPSGTVVVDGQVLPACVSLPEVAAQIESAAPTDDVEVRIVQGTYVAGKYSWKTYVAGHSISFMPIDYSYGEGTSGIAGRPAFVNDGTGATWLYASLPAGHGGGDTRLRFFYLEVSGYAESAITISGGYADGVDGVTRPVGLGANRNEFFGMVFTRVGTKHLTLPGKYGYSGLVLANSSDSVVDNCHFTKLENLAPYAASVHGVYLNHGACRNVVRNCAFTDITGAPVRTRNDSNDNDFHSSKFTRTGGPTGQYNEWFCDGTCVAANAPHGRECASHGNRFHNNDLGLGYDGTQIPIWVLSPSGQTYAGGPPCDNESQPRLSTYGNH